MQTANLKLTTLTVTVTIATAGAAFYLYKLYKNRLPTKWRKVGELSDIFVYPVKSCAPILETTMQCAKMGLKKGLLRDRDFMVVNINNGKLVTGREYPCMVLIQPKIEDDKLKLTAPGMIDVELDIGRLKHESLVTAKWGAKYEVVDCGEEIARWLSRFILSEDTGLRLVYYPQTICRQKLYPKWKNFYPNIRKDDGGVEDESFSYMMCTESSLFDLNSRLEEPVDIKRFRPNLLIRGCAPFEEDTWQYVKIGSAVFQRVKPCTRCIFTTVNPDTGVKDENVEPLKTLRAYRKILPPELAKLDNYAPVFGTNMELRVAGSIKINDAVYASV